MKCDSNAHSNINTRTPTRNTNRYYAAHVLHFKQTIEFAQETLKAVEKRANEEFSGGEWDESLKRMREEIKKTLDLCSKLEGKDNNSDGDGVKLMNMTHTAVRSVKSQTEVHAVAKTKTDEVLKAETVISS